jgi:hypothetical protein
MHLAAKRWCTTHSSRTVHTIHARYRHGTRTAYALRAHLEATIVPGRDLERNPHLQERLQCRWQAGSGWPMAWGTARHGLPPRACGLRGPLP